MQGHAPYTSDWERLLITGSVGEQGHVISDGSHLKAVLHFLSHVQEFLEK